MGRNSFQIHRRNVLNNLFNGEKVGDLFSESTDMNVVTKEETSLCGH